MTTPQDRESAKAAADAALKQAQELKEQGETLAEQWRRSRESNNFRSMLRELALRRSD